MNTKLERFASQQENSVYVGVEGIHTQVSSLIFGIPELTNKNQPKQNQEVTMRKKVV